MHSLTYAPSGTGCNPDIFVLDGFLARRLRKAAMGVAVVKELDAFDMSKGLGLGVV